MKLLEVLVKVKFFYRKNKIFQHFIFDTKKNNLKYLKSPQYKIYDKLCNKIKELTISKNGFEFLNRRDENDRIVLEFENIERKKMSNYYFVLSEFIPLKSSCSFCVYEEDMFCNFLQKYLDKKKNTCKFFREK